MNDLFQWITNLLKDARFWQIVLPWERAVRVRFGRHPKLWGPGFHLRIPFFDAIRVVNTRLQIATVPSQTLMTLDHKAVTVAANIGYRIADPLAAMMKVQQPANVCSALAQAEFALAMAPLRLDEVNLAAVERAVTARLESWGEGAIVFDFVRVVEFAAVKTFRLLNDSWRPSTGHNESSDL